MQSLGPHPRTTALKRSKWGLLEGRLPQIWNLSNSGLASSWSSPYQKMHKFLWQDPGEGVSRNSSITSIHRQFLSKATPLSVVGKTLVEGRAVGMTRGILTEDPTENITFLLLCCKFQALQLKFKENFSCVNYKPIFSPCSVGQLVFEKKRNYLKKTSLIIFF